MNNQGVSAQIQSDGINGEKHFFRVLSFKSEKTFWDRECLKKCFFRVFAFQIWKNILGQRMSKKVFFFVFYYLCKYKLIQVNTS